jgi:hypothetical protein
MIACLEVWFVGGELLKVVSDPTWLSSKSGGARWDTIGFNDAAWAKVSAVGRYGGPPWGRIDQLTDNVYGPQSAGIPGVVRVTYVPQNESVMLRNLGTPSAYAATYFDPVTGAKTSAPSIAADASGSWTCPPPPGNDHDWVLILERTSKLDN